MDINPAIQAALVTAIVGVLGALAAAGIRYMERLGLAPKLQATEQTIGSLFAFARQAVIASDEAAVGEPAFTGDKKYSLAIATIKSWAGKFGEDLNEVEAASLVNAALQEYRSSQQQAETEYALSQLSLDNPDLLAEQVEPELEPPEVVS